MNRLEREQLCESLGDAASYANETREDAAHLRRIAPTKGAAKDAYEDFANALDDAVSDFIGSKCFSDIRHELDVSETSAEHSDRMSSIRAHRAGTL